VLKLKKFYSQQKDQPQNTCQTKLETTGSFEYKGQEDKEF